MRYILAALLLLSSDLSVADDGRMAVACVSDLNRDGYCRGDLELLQAALGACREDALYDSRADLDKDGCITESDLARYNDGRVPLQQRDTCLGDIDRDLHCDYRDLALLYKAVGLCKDHRNFINEADIDESGCIDEQDRMLLFPMFISEGLPCDLNTDGVCSPADYEMFKQHVTARPQFAAAYSEDYLPVADTDRDGHLTRDSDAIRLFGLADEEEVHTLADQLRAALRESMAHGDYLEEEGSAVQYLGDGAQRLMERARANLVKLGPSIRIPTQEDGWDRAGYTAEEEFLLTLLGKEGDIILNCRLYNNLAKKGRLHTSDEKMLCPFVR